VLITVFHVSLLEPYNDPFEFHPHADPHRFELAPDNDSVTHIAAIRDTRKTGHHYEYLVHFHDTSEDDDAWVPLSDIPHTANEILERFHRRHPCAPRPQCVVLDKTYPVKEPNSDSTSSTVPSSDSSPPTTPTAVPPVTCRTPTPPPLRQNLRSNFVPPMVTTTHFGCISCPPQCLDPVHIPKPRRPPKNSTLVVPPVLKGG
jgi:hypothetical protein